MQACIKVLRLIKSADRPVEKESARSVFVPYPNLFPLWSEYEETLHAQYASERGEPVLRQVRATVPAEVFFSQQAVVDSRIHAEFFRHLPGILTGIGIIGTFLGLISGLQHFVLSDDPKQLFEGLSALIASVKEAFYASCLAISAAMLVVSLEKYRINLNYRRLKDLLQAIDALFDAGVGEEYLSDLVRSSRESATQIRQVKDSLVEDLKGLLTELTERQIAATHQASAAVATQVGDSIAANLQAPLDKIAGVVAQASGQQGDAVHGMLESLMSAFMAKLEDTIGDQMKGLSAMMAESASSMHEMQAGFQRLIADFSRIGGDASQSMAEQMRQMMTEAEARQSALVTALTRTVEQVQGQIAGGQVEIQARLAETVEGVKDAVGKILDDLAEQRRQSSAANEEDGRRRHQAMTDLLDEVRKASAQTAERYGSDITAVLGRVGAGVDASLEAMSARQSQADSRAESLLALLGQRVEALLQSSEAANAAIRDTVDRLGRTTTDAIGGMNRGAETMRQAAEGFTTAGTTVTGAISRGGELFERVSDAARGLEATAQTMRDTVAAYAQTRGSLEAMAETLRKVSQEAEQKSGLNRALLGEMEQLAKRFAETQAEARVYLERVSEVLGAGFDAFQGAMESSLDKNRGEFDRSLATAVSMIRTELQELETVLADFRSGLRS